MEQKHNFPTEVVTLPSQGLLYPKDSPLSSGKIEMKYMTAKEEDILTNQNYIANGTVIDKLLKSLVVDSKIKYGDLLVGDKNALLVAARILGYGKDYEFNFGGTTEKIDLTTLGNKDLDESLYTSGENKFSFTLPTSGITIQFRLLTHELERKVLAEINGLKKIKPDASPELSTRLKHMLISVDGNEDTKFIREFVDNRFLAIDSRAFRKYVEKIQPDVNLKFYREGGPEGGFDIPIGIGFLWPDAGL